MRRKKSPTKLTAADRSRLQTAARQAALNAYCPYSKFRVGAAVIAGGALFTGCNVENASYGLTVCAERIAIFSAIAAGNQQIDAVCVVCLDAPKNAPTESRTPCGACRQVIAEFSKSTCIVIVDGIGDLSMAELLPLGFALRPSNTSD